MVLKARTTCMFDQRVKSKTDCVRTARTRRRYSGDDGEPIGTVGIAHDVTDLENIDGNRDPSAQRCLPILVKNSDHLIINANEREFENYSNVSRKGVLGQDYASGRLQAMKPDALGEHGISRSLDRAGSTANDTICIREEPIS